MSLENEYYTEKQNLENAKATLKKFEELDVENMDDSQIDARERGIMRAKEEISETEDILSEIKVDLYDAIHDGDHVAKSTINKLIDDLTADASADDIDEYDAEVLENKINYLNEML